MFLRRGYILILPGIEPRFFGLPSRALVVCRLRGDIAPVQPGKKYEAKVSYFLLEVFIKCGQENGTSCQQWLLLLLKFLWPVPLTYCLGLCFATLQ